jgi:GAF domain-containing protein
MRSMSDRSDGNNRNNDDLQFMAELRTALAGAAAAETIGNPTPPEKLMDMIVRAAARAIPCPEGALMLIDRKREVLTFDVVIGSTAATVKDITVPLGHGIAGLVAVSGQALAVANAQKDPRHARDVAEKSGYLPTTILAVPVVSPDGAPVGVLELLDRQGQPTFDLADIELLGMFADQLAVVLDLRRSHHALGARVGTVIAAFANLPPQTARVLSERAEGFASSVEADETSRRTHELAQLVVSVASRGPAEHEACLRVLSAFADYLETRPSLGVGMFG